MFFFLGHSVFSLTTANNAHNAMPPKDVRLSFGRRRPQRGVGRPEEWDNCQVHPLFPSPSTPTHTHPQIVHKPSTRHHYLLTTDENNGETTTTMARGVETVSNGEGDGTASRQ